MAAKGSLAPDMIKKAKLSFSTHVSDLSTTLETTNDSYQSKVFRGDQTGRTINFPTVNLDPKILPQGFKQGIYASLVEYNQKEYHGALYFGPRLVMNETKNVLEIFILDFDKEIYGETVSFAIKNFVRPIQNFSSLEGMKQQLVKDIEEIRKVLE